MKKNIVSVVIPTYNEEKDIQNCLESLKKQEIKDLEIIIVDDGSTDNTLGTIEETAKIKKLKIIILKQNHQGPGKARNLGAKQATGEILIFVDADMTFDKNYIKNLIKPILDDKDKKIIGTTHDYEIATNTDKKYSALWGKIRVDYRKNKNEALIFRAIRKNKFLEFGGFDSKYGYADDQTFWFKYKIRPVVAENTLCYHKNPETLKSTYKQARWIGASWKERFFVLKIPIINHIISICLFVSVPFISILKSLKNTKFKFSDKILFYCCKFLGYSVGVFRAIYLSKVYK
jgi:glycosyltransferase involved in cell wall biosynthesis